MLRSILHPLGPGAVNKIGNNHGHYHDESFYYEEVIDDDEQSDDEVSYYEEIIIDDDYGIIKKIMTEDQRDAIHPHLEVSTATPRHHEEDYHQYEEITIDDDTKEHNTHDVIVEEIVTEDEVDEAAESDYEVASSDDDSYEDKKEYEMNIKDHCANNKEHDSSNIVDDNVITQNSRNCEYRQHDEQNTRPKKIELQQVDDDESDYEVMLNDHLAVVEEEEQQIIKDQVDDNHMSLSTEKKDNNSGQFGQHPRTKQQFDNMSLEYAKTYLLGLPETIGSTINCTAVSSSSTTTTSDETNDHEYEGIGGPSEDVTPIRPRRQPSFFGSTSLTTLEEVTEYSGESCYTAACTTTIQKHDSPRSVFDLKKVQMKENASEKRRRKIQVQNTHQPDMASLSPSHLSGENAPTETLVRAHDILNSLPPMTPPASPCSSQVARKKASHSESPLRHQSRVNNRSSSSCNDNNRSMPSNKSRTSPRQAKPRSGRTHDNYRSHIEPEAFDSNHITNSPHRQRLEKRQEHKRRGERPERSRRRSRSGSRRSEMRRIEHDVDNHSTVRDYSRKSHHASSPSRSHGKNTHQRDLPNTSSRARSKDRSHRSRSMKSQSRPKSESLRSKRKVSCSENIPDAHSSPVLDCSNRSNRSLSRRSNRSRSLRPIREAATHNDASHHRHFRDVSKRSRSSHRSASPRSSGRRRSRNRTRSPRHSLFASPERSPRVGLGKRLLSLDQALGSTRSPEKRTPSVVSGRSSRTSRLSASNMSNKHSSQRTLETSDNHSIRSRSRSHRHHPSESERSERTYTCIPRSIRSRSESRHRRQKVSTNKRSSVAEQNYQYDEEELSLLSPGSKTREGLAPRVILW